MNLDALIDRWSASGDAERANKDSFLNEKRFRDEMRRRKETARRPGGR
jgi:hypothetical protein